MNEEQLAKQSEEDREFVREFLEIKEELDNNVKVIRDAEGKITEVVVPWQVYEKLLEKLEDIEDMATIDRYLANKQTEEFVPFEEAVKELEDEWQKD